MYERYYQNSIKWFWANVLNGKFSTSIITMASKCQTVFTSFIVIISICNLIHSRKLKGDLHTIGTNTQKQRPKLQDSSFNDSTIHSTGSVRHQRSKEEYYSEGKQLEEEYQKSHSRSKRAIFLPSSTKFKIENDLKIQSFSKFDGNISKLLITITYT